MVSGMNLAVNSILNIALNKTIKINNKKTQIFKN